MDRQGRQDRLGYHLQLNFQKNLCPRKMNPSPYLFLLLSLIDDKDRLPVAGRVVWITPNGAQGGRPAGIGEQFNEGSDGDTVRTKIESNLAGLMASDKPTQTM